MAAKTEALIKEKMTKSKAKSQSLVSTTVQPDESTTKSNGSNRKTKEKAIPPNPSTQPQQPAKAERQRSTSLSPALSSSSNPTPPPISSSSSPSSSQEGCFSSSMQHQMLQQGASLAAEEEEIDRARDEAEDFGKPKKIPTNATPNAFGLTDSSANQDCPETVQTVTVAAPPPPPPAAAPAPAPPPPSFSHSHPILDNSNNHSFFSTGPLPAYTARSNGTSPPGCKLKITLSCSDIYT